MSEPYQIDIHKILKLLPHRYPMLLVDRVLECVPGERVVAIKNVTVNEPFFPGHFPYRPIMPGVLMLEALAQATGLLAFETQGEAHSEKELYYFVGMDKVRFRKPAEPGDQLIMTVELKRRVKNIWKFDGRIEVDGIKVAEAELMCASQEFDD
jgi:3-hydroxyacyl-[acyl-carrier-protein] dehydratase